MRGSISNFLSSSSLTQKSSNPGSQVFHIRPSSKDSSLLVVHPAGYPKDAPPIYCIKVNPNSKPNVMVSRGLMSPQTTVGFAKFHYFSSTTELFVRGQPIPLKASFFSGKYSLDVPGMGKFKWKPNQLTGSSFELYDGAGRKLAKLGSAGLLSFGEKKLEIMVPCDDFFMDLVILSAISVKELSKIAEEAASEAAQAVVGAA